MSAIIFKTKSGGEARISGSERAYMSVYTRDLAWGVMQPHCGLWSEHHPLANVLDDSEKLYPGLYLKNHHDRDRDPFRTHQMIERDAEMYLGGFSSRNVTFNGETHDLDNVTMNTALVMGDVSALLSKIHGLCEIHAWVADGDREWLAELIDKGRRQNILRPEMGWEGLSELLRDTDGMFGDVVSEYTVCDSFPNSHMAEVDDEQFNRMSPAERWDIGMDSLRKTRWLQLSPETLTGYYFMKPVTVFDMVASPEWRSDV